MMSKEDDKQRSVGLMQKFNALGRLLPDEDSIVEPDAAGIAEAKIILREMEATKAQIDKALGIEHRPLMRTRNTDPTTS
jgi:hypothetical protein